MANNVTNLETDSWSHIKLEARVRSVSGHNVPSEVVRAVADANIVKPYWVDPENPDLVWVNFILDSEGDNKNWDYMPLSQLVASYKTAKFKPLDMEHVVEEDGSMVYMDKQNPPVKNTIYGVMTQAYLSDANGKPLNDKQVKALAKTKDDPDRPMKDRVTVSAWAAMYYFLFPATVQGMVKSIAADSMKVSMERWIKVWDFLVQDGETWKVVSRADAEKNGVSDRWKRKQTMGSSKILRRTLKYSYGGVASTTNPANPISRFIDKSAVDAVKAAAAKTNPTVRFLVERHGQVVSAYAVSSDEAEKSALAAEHLSIHQALASLGVT